MRHFAQLADVMQVAVGAIEEQKWRLFCYNTQLIRLFGLRNATPAFYEMFHFHQFGWEVREGTVSVYTELGSRIIVCGEHKLQRHPERGLSVLSEGQNAYTILDEAKRKS